MGIRTWRGEWIVGLWLGAIILAVAAVRIGDALRPTLGQARGFFVGSLFVWMIWIPVIATYRWTSAREREYAGRPGGAVWRVARVLLNLLIILWAVATIAEYLGGLL